MSFACFVFCCCPRMRFARSLTVFAFVFQSYVSVLNLAITEVTSSLSQFLCSAWYFVGQAYLGFGGEAAGSFIIYVILNLTVYSVLPIAWRKFITTKPAYNFGCLHVCCSVTFFLASFTHGSRYIHHAQYVYPLLHCWYVDIVSFRKSFG